MKQCPVCGLTVEDREPFCPRCSAEDVYKRQVPQRPLPGLSPAARAPRPLHFSTGCAGF